MRIKPMPHPSPVAVAPRQRLRPRTASCWRHQAATLALAAVSTIVGVTTLPARADGGKRLQPASPPTAWQQECAACHIAYPPALLPAESWQRLMAGLQKHFGTDASLDAATTRQLSEWLQREAGTGRRVSPAPPEDRITRGAWFLREHREVSTATWRLPAVQSAARCTACHQQADRGDFNEHQIRIPR
jgi:Dihaem cytochrome c